MSTPAWYPIRLIDIGESIAPAPHLIVNSENTPDGPYITLSHCSGPVRSLQLTSSSIDGVKQLIPLSEPPLTIRQSFEITRRLGFHYIWIDSLCILYDNSPFKIPFFLVL